MIRKKFFDFLSKNAISSRGTWIIAFSAVLTVVSLFLIPRLPIYTSRDGMVDENLAVQKRYLDYNREFGTPNQLVLLVEGKQEKLRPAIDALAESLISNPEWVKNVFYKIDLEPIKKSGLYYVPLEDIKKLNDSLGEYTGLLSSMLENGSLADVLAELEKKTGEISPDDMKDEKALSTAFDMIDRLFSQWLSFLKTPEKAELTIDDEIFGQVAADRDKSIDKNGYLIGKDGQMYVMFVQQSQPRDDTEFTMPFMEYCRKQVAETMKDFPDVEVGLTGWPVFIEDEINLIYTDLLRVTMISGFVVLALFLFAFRSIHRTLLAFIPLVFGILWSLAVTLFTIGHLNYLTSVFVGILFGLGIDYGVVFVRRYDEESAKGISPGEAVSNMLHSVGPSISTGAATTIAAFFAIGMTDQPAFSELGFVAGTGVICVIISTLFLMPVLMVKFPPKLDAKGAERRSESKILRNLSGHYLRFPVTLFVLGVILVLALATQVPKVGFDYNINNLLPADSEAFVVSKKMEEHTSYKLQYVTLVTDTFEQAAQLQPLLEKLPTVQRVESISMLIPEDQGKKQQVFPQILEKLQSIPLKIPEGNEVDLAKLSVRLDSLEEKVLTAQEDAFSDGRKSLVKHLDNVADRIDELKSALKLPDAAKNEARFEKEIFSTIANARNEFANMCKSPPVSIKTISSGLRDRFQASTGRFATYIFPTKQIWDLDFLDDFLGEVEGASAKILGKEAPLRTTGFGVVFRTTSKQIRDGFKQSTWMAALVVFIMLFLDFRKPILVMMAATPVVVAILVTMGIYGLLGIKLNLASQISFPILLGIGVDYGILVTRRWMEEDGLDLHKVIATVGWAITLAAAETMAGFGGLLFAKHRGLTSFGQLLVIAIAVTLMAALIGLPIMVQALRLEKRKTEEGPKE